MWRFWNSCLEPALDILQPRAIVEVGTDEGKNTINLVQWAQANKALVHVVDPLPKYDTGKVKSQSGPHVMFHLGLSLDVLPHIPDYQVLLLDGDHNWYTVHHELLAVEQAMGAERFPLTFFHDIHWPYGRRDLYYDPAAIPEERRQPHRKAGMAPGKRELLPEGGMNAHLHNAELEGGPRNGVLTGIEDYLARGTVPGRFVQLPGNSGLGVFAPEQVLARSPSVQSLLDALEPNPYMAAHLQSVESERIRARMERQEVIDMVQRAGA